MKKSGRMLLVRWSVYLGILIDECITDYLLDMSYDKSTSDNRFRR